MANKRPEYYYHPAVGIVSPASLSLFKLNSGIAPLDSIPAVPAPVASAALPALSAPAPVINTLPLPPAIPAPRRAMTLSRTEACVVTGEQVPLPDLIRFVIDPQNRIVPDLAEKLPGQAFYITAELAIIKKAIWRNSFAMVARDKVTIPDDLLQVLENGLSRLALETISLAKRSGNLLCGFAAVEEELRKTGQGVYVVASDASDHGRLKLEKLARPRPVLDLWTSTELSAAIGEANTNHLMLTPGGLAEKLLRTAKKLKAVRSDS